MRVLVTGGAGFVGSHLVEGLLAAGHDVAALDNFATGRRENLPSGAHLYQVDIRDADAVTAVLGDWRPEVVYHLAAQSAVRVSIERPDFDADVNVVGALRLLAACLATGVRRMVYTSTGGALYGEPMALPADELCPVFPLAPYGLSKHTFERYLDMATTGELERVILRPANIYGPRQDPHGEAGVVAIFAERMLRGEPVRIFGSGDQQRDFVYVGDVVEAALLASSSHLTGAYNIGTGRLTSVNELFSALAVATGYDRAPQYTPAIPGEVFRISLDASKAERELGWAPVTPLDGGLGLTVEAFRNAME
ncbi:MAG: NAD-dependent epimerase/dehydratase family protein [Dehalococcoidia bacterium]|nr:NAD-dependent epimerase/dehydratase family protein [Dehalococcoidia bacterium]